MNHTASIVMIALASVLMLSGIAAAQPASNQLLLCSAAEGMDHQVFTMADSANPIDLQWCQRQCASDYGVEPYFRGGDGTARWYMYTSCIQDCNRKFWKEYDREMRDLERSTK